MTSQIDPSKPTENKAYTADVRANFLFARDEISLLQETVASLQAQIDNSATLAGVGTWAWQSGPLINVTIAAPPTKPTVGLDADTPATATALSVTPADANGSDFAAALQTLQVGDGLLLWQVTDSAKRMRFDVTAPGSLAGSYFTVPIAASQIAGTEPINGVDVKVQFIFAARGGQPA